MAIQLNVEAPPRGSGTQAPVAFQAQALKLSLAWGGSPSTATVLYPGGAVDEGVGAGALVQMRVGGMTFRGLCRSDVAVTSARGYTRELQFVDLREFLSWDYVKGSFNNPVRRLDGGVWKKRWWHIFPADFDLYLKTWTDAPLRAWEIVAKLLTAPTVGSPWSWDFTGNGAFPDGLLNAPVFQFDCLQGMRLDAALNDISERGGLVYCLDSTEQQPYRLVWTRKGYGTVPIGNTGFAAEADERRAGLALSGHATNINVMGERNRYTVLNLPLTPDWNRAWEVFLTPDLLAKDLFDHEVNPLTSEPYNAYASDPEQWIGAHDAKARALSITVAEYVALRNARSAGTGNAFIDRKKFAGRSRMDMPAALYIETLVFRAYKPNPAAGGITNINGAVIPLTSVALADALLCRIDYDPASGAMTADPTVLTDSNGLVLVQAAVFGQDLFQLVKPERVDSIFFALNNRPWTSVPLQVDDSGDGQRFIILEQPAFTAENILVTVDGWQVLNATPTLNPATAKAALTFECEPFSYWKGTWPNVSRDRVEFVSGLLAEYVGEPGSYQEISYVNGETALQQADRIASDLLLCQYVYAMGGYKLNWHPLVPLRRFAVFLSSVIDRVDLEIGPNGVVAIVDFTTERERDHFIPERDLERRTLQNTLFPGQSALRAQALDYRRFAAAIKSTPLALRDRFIRFLKGDFGEATVVETRFANAGGATGTGLNEVGARGLNEMAGLDEVGGTAAATVSGTVPVGTPLFKAPVDHSTWPPTGTLATWPAAVDPDVDNLFIGVTTTHQQPAAGTLYAQADGEALAWVQGPVAVHDPLGIAAAGYAGYDGSNGSAWLAKNAARAVGTALQPITTATKKLIKVKLSAGGGGGSACDDQGNLIG